MGAEATRVVGIDEAFALGGQQYRAGAFDAAAGIFARICTLKANHAEAMGMLGLCRLAQGATDEAIGLLTKAQALAPDDAMIQLRMGMALHAAGRHTEAAARFRSAAMGLPDDPAPLVNLATALLALGRPQAALAAAMNAGRRAPQSPHASYMAGLALLALERVGEAANAFAAAVKHAPDFADAWLNLGICLYRNTSIEGAKAAMRRVLQIAPGHPAATGNLGAFLRLSGDGEGAENLLRAALAADPGQMAARLNLVAGLLQEERAQEALALLEERPLPSDGAAARHARLLYSLALIQAGRIADARAMLDALGDVPPQLLPQLLWRRLLLALADGNGADAVAYAGAMEVALAAPGILPEHGIMAHFDLAKFWSRAGEPRRAFPHWEAGHRLISRFQPFSRLDTGAFQEALIEKLDARRLKRGPRATNRDVAPVFIVGMPRSGTTLCEQIIAAHPQAFGGGERNALPQAFHRLAGGLTPEGAARVAGLDKAALDTAAAGYLAELHALAPGAARIADKLPGNFLFLGLAALMLPGARFIHCVRDPRDIGLSIFTFRFYGYHPYAHDLADLGWYIGRQQRLMAHWKAALPGRILTVALSDWVTDFDATLRCVLAFLDLPYDAACARFHEQDSHVRTVSRTQVRQPVNNRGIGRWRIHATELQPLIASLIESGALPQEISQ